MNHSIASSFSACLGVYQDLVNALSAATQPIRDEISWSELEDELGRLKVWAGNIAAHKVGRASLDFRLRDASPLRERIIGLLEDMESMLLEAIPIITGDRKARDEAASDTDSSDDDLSHDLGSHSNQGQRRSTTELQQTLLDIVDIIDCLYKLSITIRNPSPHDRLVKAASIDTSFYEHWDIQHVKNKFPAAKDYLSVRLGKAVSRRRQYLQYREKHRKKLAQDLEPPPRLKPVKQPLKADTQTAPTVSVPLNDYDAIAAFGQGNEAEPSVIATTVLTQTTASEFFGGNAEFEVESDSGQTQTSYATSVGIEGSLSIPPLPKESQGGRPFECSYCFTIVSVKNSRSWRKHILRDLQPYVCTFEPCSKGSKLFDSRHEWFDHELLAHRKEWVCSAGCEESFSLQTEFEDHMRNTHAKAFSEHQLVALVDMCQRPVEEDSEAQCPLCVAPMGSMKQLCRHLARHLESLALFALPRSKDEDKEEAEFGSDRVQLSDASRGLSDGSLSFRSKSQSQSGSEGSESKVETETNDEISEFLNDFKDSDRLPPSFTHNFQQRFRDYLRTGQHAVLGVFIDVGKVVLGPDFEQLMNSESNVRDIISLFYLEATTSLEKQRRENMEKNRAPPPSYRSEPSVVVENRSQEPPRIRTSPPLNLAALSPHRTHRKERIVIVDAPPTTSAAPPQLYNNPYTLANTPATAPRIVEKRPIRYPIIFDGRPGALDEAAALFVQLMMRALAETMDGIEGQGLMARLEGLRSKLLARSSRLKMLSGTKATETPEPQVEGDHLLDPDWAKCWGITETELEKLSELEVTRQRNIHAIWTSERTYLEGLDTLITLYQDDLIDDPRITQGGKRLEFIEKIFAMVDEIRKIHEPLIRSLKTRLLQQGPLVETISGIYTEWLRPEVKQAYFQYAREFMSSEVLILSTMKRNPQFKQAFEIEAGLMDWIKYLRNPMGKIQQGIRLLIALRGTGLEETRASKELQEDINEMQSFYASFEAHLQWGAAKASRTELAETLVLPREMENTELNLDDESRQLLYKGDLIQRSTNGNIQIILACLFDHYFILSAPIQRRYTADSGGSETVYEVKKLPIPMSLLLLEDSNDEPIPVPETIVLKGFDASLLFPFRIKHLGRLESYTLYTRSQQSRDTWREQIVTAIEAHASTEELGSNPPFSLSVLADYKCQSRTNAHTTRSVRIKGSAIDKALQELEADNRQLRLQHPELRPLDIGADVTCATIFKLSGLELVAIGTEEGFMICKTQSRGGWNEFIKLRNVKQMFADEEYNFLLILASGRLWAYQADSTWNYFCGTISYGSSNPELPQRTEVAGSASLFAVGRMKERDLIVIAKKETLYTSLKVLEPIKYELPAKKTLSWFRNPKAKRPHLFREYDELDFPAECFGINLFNQYLAVSTARGLDTLSLDKKVTFSVPNLKNPDLASIAIRLKRQRSLGMFRLPTEEFFCCYEETGVYIDKYGDVSRTLVMEFVGKAKKAALVDKYILLFNDDFVEIRDVLNGKLRQVIAGQNVRCLDDAQAGLKRRNVVIVMAHPELEDRQLVLELRLEKAEIREIRETELGLPLL